MMDKSMKSAPMQTINKQVADKLTKRIAARKPTEAPKKPASATLVQGTVQQLLARGMKINGRHVDAVSLSVLAKFGIGACVGEGQKPPTGRTPKVHKYEEIYQLKVTINYEE